MQRLMKFLHTTGSIGFAGSMAALIVLLHALPDPAQLAEYARMRQAMADIADWIFLPAFVMMIVSGLLAIAARPAFQEAGWVWIKLATGIVVFEGGLNAVHGPMRHEAILSSRALAGEIELSRLGASLDSELWSLWLILALALLNVVLGVWRPRLRRRRPA